LSVYRGKHVQIPFARSSKSLSLRTRLFAETVQSGLWNVLFKCSQFQRQLTDNMQVLLEKYKLKLYHTEQEYIFVQTLTLHLRMSSWRSVHPGRNNFTRFVLLRVSLSSAISDALYAATVLSESERKS
jgi:hypothetical protein